MSSKAAVRRINSVPVDDNRIHYAKGCDTKPAIREPQINSWLRRLTDTALRLRDKLIDLDKDLSTSILNNCYAVDGDNIKSLDEELCGLATQIREIERILIGAEHVADSIKSRCEL